MSSPEGPNDQPGYVAEYVLAPRRVLPVQAEAAQVMRQRVFDAAESRNLHVTVVQRMRQSEGEQQPTAHLHVTMTSAEEIDTLEPDALGAAAARVIRTAFPAAEWRVAGVRVRSFREMAEERAVARNRSLGTDEFLSEDDLVDRMNVSPAMAKVLLADPEMRKFFRTAAVERSIEQPPDSGIDRR